MHSTIRSTGSTYHPYGRPCPLVTFCNPKSPILFCKKQLDPDLNGQSAADINTLPFKDYLDDGQYKPILLSLWQLNITDRLAWLDKHAGLHPILMCERAITLFVKTPTIETINRTTIPLIKAASARTEQDGRCIRDEICKTAYEILEEIYFEILKNKITEHASTLPIDLENRKLNTRGADRQKIIEVLSSSDPLPSPCWITQHIEQSNEQNKKISPLMLPVRRWENLRRTFASEKISALNTLHL